MRQTQSQSRLLFQFARLSLVPKVEQEKLASTEAWLITGRNISRSFQNDRKDIRSGRFLENLPASVVLMFLIMDHQNGTLEQQIDAVAKFAGGVDTVVAIDTGGDALYSLVKVDSAKATPDQDLRVLETLHRFYKRLKPNTIS